MIKDRNVSQKILLAVFLAILFVTVPRTLAAGAHQTDKQAVIGQAKRSYYSLRSLGLAEFQAKLQPNWPVAVKGIESNPKTMKLLNGLKFSMTLGQDDKVKVDHEATVAATSPSVEAGFKQIFEGIDQFVIGFFDTWKLFMLNSPFPEVSSEYKLEDRGNEYLVTYKEGSADISTRMTKEFGITEISVSSSEFKSTIKPRLTKTDKGYVMTGFQGTYLPTSGAGKAEIDAQITYQEVNGLQLPLKLHANSSYDGSSNETEISFSDYKVRSR